MTLKLFEKFYQKEQRFIQNRDMKQEEEKKKRENTSFSFRPKIIDYSPSRGIAKTTPKASQPVWERLYPNYALP